MGIVGDEPTPISRAIGKVQRRGHERGFARLPLMLQPHAWPADADVTLRAPDDPDDPALLLWEPDDQGWRWIRLPPGSVWRIRPDQPSASPKTTWWQRLLGRVKP